MHMLEKGGDGIVYVGVSENSVMEMTREYNTNLPFTNLKWSSGVFTN